VFLVRERAVRELCTDADFDDASANPRYQHAAIVRRGVS
jgi:hypothetical protein